MVQGGGLLDAVIVALSACALASLCIYRVRKVQIAHFARSATRGSRTRQEAAFALGRVIFAQILRRRRDPLFLSSVLRSMGPSPVAVLKTGGCCSGLNRLYITALDTLGIRAGQVTVFRRADPQHAHCFAQVTAGSAKLLIDVDYGVWFCRRDGEPTDLAGLRAGVEPAIEPFVQDCKASHADINCNRPAGYPGGEYYRFDYVLTRNANWAETRPRRIAYALLHPLTRGRVDCVLLPPILEWPEILLAGTLCAVAVALLAARALFAPA